MSYIEKIITCFERKRVLRHIFFWSAILLFTIPKSLLDKEVMFALSEHSTALILARTLCLLIPQVLASYFMAYFIIPNYLSKKKPIFTLLVFFISTYLFLVLGRILIIKVAEPMYRTLPYVQEPLIEIFIEVKFLFKYYLPAVYSTVLIFLFVKYFINHNAIKEREYQTRSNKFATEIKMLKAQLNPHFLFNTLNNIYTLSLDNSPKTSVSISKLSQILDYILYKCNSKFVLLTNEVQLLKNYIELQKLRYDERLQVSFTESIENEAEIPPLILLSLVENAFKHGAGEDDGNPKITIKVLSKGHTFVFNISNTISNHHSVSYKEGIGLSNVKKQLDMIYDKNYSLEIDRTASIFTVTLKIKLIL